MDDIATLERKLKLLKESLDAGVIDAEEYSRNREKIEGQLIKAKEPPKEQASLSSFSQEAHSQQEEPGKVEEHKEPPKKQPLQSREPQEEPSEPTQANSEKQAPHTETISHTASEEHPPKVDHQEHPITSKGQKPKESHTLAIILWAIGAIVLIGILVLFSITLEEAATNETSPGKGEVAHEPLFVCSNDADCAMPGFESRCQNPGTLEAFCERRNSTSIDLTILTADCSACNPSRVEGILAGWFPGISTREISSDSDERQALIEEHSITMLPAFIVGKSAENAFIFNDVKNAFRLSGESYVMKESASGAALYLTRKEVPRTMDIFISWDETASQKTLLNMEEFLDQFSSEINLRVHIVKESASSEEAACVSSAYPTKVANYLICTAKGEEGCLEKNSISPDTISACAMRGEGKRAIATDAALQKSLGMNVPSFLINNNLRISGVQAADTLRAQYCEWNPGELCSVELRKNLV